MSGFASFLVGMGGGYLKAKDKQHDRDKEAKEDQWRDEQRERQRREWNDSDRLKAEMADASRPVTGTAGHKVTDAAGSDAFTQDAGAADMMRDMAQTKNGGATMAGATRVGEQAYTDPAKAQEALAAENSEDAISRRQIQTLRNNGKPLEANQMQSAALDMKAKQLGLSVAEMQFADQMTRKQMGDALTKGKTWHEGAAQFITESQFPGIRDVKAESVVSPDGKSVTLFAVMPDGTKQARGTFPAGDDGAMAFMEKFGALPIETRMSLMQGRATAAQAQSNSDRDFDLRRRETESQMEYRNRTLAIQRAQEGRAAAAHRTTMEDAKIPPAVKMQAASIAKQIENIGTALNKAMAEGQFDPNNPGTARLLEQQTTLNLKYSQLVKPYIPGAGGAAGADPLGLSNPAAAPAAAGAPAGAAPAAPAPAARAPAKAPPAVAPPAPTMEQIQTQTRQNRERILQQGEKAKEAERDPDVQALRRQHAVAIRAGKPMDANAIAEQINKVKAQRYGLQ